MRGVHGGPSAVFAFRFTVVIIFIMGLENRSKNITIIAAKLLSLLVHPTGGTQSDEEGTGSDRAAQTSCVGKSAEDGHWEDWRAY